MLFAATLLLVAISFLAFFIARAQQQHSSKNSKINKEEDKDGSRRASRGERVQAAAARSGDVRRAEITEDDLHCLVSGLEQEMGSQWELVLEKRSSMLTYRAHRREPKNESGPTEYMSTTVFHDCSPELLRDFYMDNEFRLQWDKTVVAHNKLDLCSETGTETGRIVKKFPFMALREYVLSWRLWEGQGNVYFCVIKDLQHPRAPKRPGFVRVERYSSGWRIRPVGSGSCEVKILHAEDAGVRRDMARMAFSRGIWSYMRKTEQALRRYRPPSQAPPSAVSCRHKAPLKLAYDAEENDQQQGRPKAKRRSVTLLTQGIFLLGWAVILGHGSTSLAAKMAATVFANKAVQRSSSRRTRQSFMKS